MLKQLVKSNNSRRKGVTHMLFLIGVVTLLCLTGVSIATGAPIFSGESVYANSSSSAATDIYVTITDAISIRTLNKDITEEISSLPLGVTPVSSGKFVKNTTQVDVSTSNPSGYNLYMSSSYLDHASNYTTDMIHADSSVNDVIANLSASNVTEAAFSAPSSASSPNANVDHWGYSLNAVTTSPANITSGSSSVTVTDNADPSSITYNPLPAHDNAVLIRDDVATSVEHSYTPVTIGANVDTNVVSGTYTNNLVFSTIVNPPYVDYSLHFIANTDRQGGDDSTVSNLPADIEQRVMATSYTITVPTAVPTRTGYVFDGYNTKPDGTGDTYNPGDGYTLIVEDEPGTQVESASGTLYAIWRAVSYTVTFDRQDGTGGPDSATVTYDSTMKSIAKPSRTGYTFGGYYTSTEGKGTQYYTATGAGARVWDIASNTTLYAKWILNTWTDTNNKVWTYQMGSGATWANASSFCPSGYRLPTRAEYNTLIADSTNISRAYTYLGGGDFWSSTESSTSAAYYIYIDGTATNTKIYSRDKTTPNRVVCTK